ncbi:MAG TPA: hypothetical protein VFG47_19455, partial [Geminicoccaceae bacterium]|nr:hypothetical protein [Geminicoccaceae bacterium]
PVPPFRAHADNLRLRVLPDAVELEREEQEGGPARLLLTDVALAGHDRATAALALAGGPPATARLILLDQASGAEIGRAEARLEPGGPALLAVPLHGLHVAASLLLELDGPALACRLGRLEIV